MKDISLKNLEIEVKIRDLNVNSHFIYSMINHPNYVSLISETSYK